MRTTFCIAMSASPSIGARSGCTTERLYGAGQRSLRAQVNGRVFSAAYYDDELEVCGRIARIGTSSMRFVVEIYRRRQYEPCW